MALVPDTEETLNRLMVHKFKANTIRWPTKESCETNPLLAKLKQKLEGKIFGSNTTNIIESSVDSSKLL